MLLFSWRSPSWRIQSSGQHQGLSAWSQQWLCALHPKSTLSGLWNCTQSGVARLQVTIRDRIRRLADAPSMQEAPVHESVQRALSSPLSVSYNGSASPPTRANSAGSPLFHISYQPVDSMRPACCSTKTLLRLLSCLLDCRTAQVVTCKAVLVWQIHASFKLMGARAHFTVSVLSGSWLTQEMFAGISGIEDTFWSGPEPVAPMPRRRSFPALGISSLWKAQPSSGQLPAQRAQSPSRSLSLSRMHHALRAVLFMCMSSSNQSLLSRMQQVELAHCPLMYAIALHSTPAYCSPSHAAHYSLKYGRLASKAYVFWCTTESQAHHVRGLPVLEVAVSQRLSNRMRSMVPHAWPNFMLVHWRALQPQRVLFVSRILLLWP